MRSSQTLRAGLIAAVISGIPSTMHAIVTGRDPLEATAAAGSLVLDASRPRAQLLAAAAPVHLAISLFWTYLLTAILPRTRRRRAGAVAGVVIAYLDLDVLGRRRPRVRALTRWPQYVDHVLFAVTVAHLTAQERDGDE